MTQRKNTHHPDAPTAVRLPTHDDDREVIAHKGASESMVVGVQMVGSPLYYTGGSHTHQLHIGATHEKRKLQTRCKHLERHYLGHGSDSHVHHRPDEPRAKSWGSRRSGTACRAGREEWRHDAGNASYRSESGCAITNTFDTSQSWNFLDKICWCNTRLRQAIGLRGFI